MERENYRLQDIFRHRSLCEPWRSPPHNQQRRSAVEEFASPVAPQGAKAGSLQNRLGSSSNDRIDIGCATPSNPRQQDRFPGGHRRGVTPVPIPNTEVKPSTADGTAWVTAWESRSLPGLFPKRPNAKASGLFFRTPPDHAGSCERSPGPASSSPGRVSERASGKRASTSRPRRRSCACMSASLASSSDF